SRATSKAFGVRAAETSNWTFTVRTANTARGFCTIKITMASDRPLTIGCRMRVLLLTLFCSLLTIWQSPAYAEEWVARHDLTSSEYQSAFDQYTKEGYRLLSASGYVQNGERFLG